METAIEPTVISVAKSEISESSLGIVRASFNPSAKPEVDQIKLLAARLITLMEPIRDARGDAGRCAALAITQIETACIFGVKAATA